MKPIHDISSGERHLRAMLYAVRSKEESGGFGRAGGRRVLPFITISRQAGSGGRTLGQRLVERLRDLDPADPSGLQPAWSCWDHELVEKVSAEHHIAEALVEAMEDNRRPWVAEFLAGFSNGEQQPEEFAIYRRVAAAIHALASAGRAVIVGRGGVHITSRLPGGTHVRLVAPLDCRVAQMARRLNVSEKEAAERVHEIDRNRTAFFKRHWPSRTLSAETFTVTYNTCGLSEDQMVEGILPLVCRSAGVQGTPRSNTLQGNRERETAGSLGTRSSLHVGAVHGGGN